MRKIVDRNFLQTQEFREYLSSSKKNIAIFTDYAAMESFKGDSIDNISSAMKIFSDFPRQLVVLKSTREISALSGCRFGVRWRMIDKDQTKGFPDWCQGLDKAMAGDQELKRQILENGRAADAHLDIMLADQDSFADNLEEVTKHFTNAELKELRKDEPISKELFLKIFDNILEMAKSMFAAHPDAPKLPSARRLPYTFIFRYALTGYLVALRWIAVGGAKNVKPAKIRNDIVDATYAAYATYYDGLLSNDVKANEIYEEAKSFLELILAVPPPRGWLLR